MKKFALAIAFAVSLLAAFAAGGHVARKQTMAGIETALHQTQAMLWFNHLLDFRRIESDLVRGCSLEALEKTRIAIDQEMKLLASFHAERPDSKINKYMSDRDPQLLEQLKTFKSKYGDSWHVPKCSK